MHARLASLQNRQIKPFALRLALWDRRSSCVVSSRVSLQAPDRLAKQSSADQRPGCSTTDNLIKVDYKHNVVVDLKV